MRVEKDEIEQDLDRLCRDLIGLLEQHLIPAAGDGEEKVFYCKMYVAPTCSESACGHPATRPWRYA